MAPRFNREPRVRSRQPDPFVPDHHRLDPGSALRLSGTPHGPLRVIGERIWWNGHYDLTRAAMRRAIVKFGRKARTADLAVVYFAGHGIEVNGENWLLPVDMDKERKGSCCCVRTLSIGPRTARSPVDTQQEQAHRWTGTGPQQAQDTAVYA